MRVAEVASKVVEYSFYILFFVVPIIWLPMTSELFEFNKMILVYLVTSVILTVWLLKSVEERSFTVKRTPLDLPILLFLLAMILSTVFSMDWQTSVFGYYSRFNGGLLSIISYIILYYALVTFFDKEKIIRLLKVLIASSTLVAIYAIFQHPTPFFRNEDGSFRGIDADYWQPNSEKRSFSTLGHANWLAAFMLMVIPFAFFLLAHTQKTWEKVAYSLFLILIFLAFTFTYSRGGTLGFVAMVLTIVFGIFFALKLTPTRFKAGLKNLKRTLRPPKTGFFVSLVVAGWLITVFFFGNAFTSRGINFASITAENETQLASHGAETGKIRLIVWKGGLEIFKNFPVFGSGLETFAFSYYQYRPAEHNLLSEWDFLYNKAHNEFVNYLSTTGSLGFSTYILLIISAGIWLLRYVWLEKSILYKFFAISVLASYIGYHVQNFFGFSVVTIALLFFLLPAFLFITSRSLRETRLEFKFLKKDIFAILVKGGVFILGIALFLGTLNMWVADYFYNRGISFVDAQESYNNLKIASQLRPDEPLYKAALGMTTIVLAETGPRNDRNSKISEAFDYLNKASEIAPNNINIWTLRFESIYGLTNIDERYLSQAIKTTEILAELAPTDARIQYNLATTYVAANDLKKAQSQLEKVIDLRFIYKDAWDLLFEVDKELKDEKALKKHMEEYKVAFPKNKI